MKLPIFKKDDNRLLSVNEEHKTSTLDDITNGLKSKVF